MTLQNAEKLIDEIASKRSEYLKGKIQRFPASNFRASDIGECDRQMVYSVLNWQDKTLHDEGLQAVFDRGNEEEQRVIRDLSELGFVFMAQQNPIEIKNNKGEVICRGRIDGKILFNGEAIPCEIKSMNMNTFGSLKTLDDFQKKPLHRKYLKQMTLYLFGNNEEAGLFILSDLQGHYKLILITLDYGEAETILQRLERNWESVKKKEYPPQIEYNDSLCNRCAYKHICLTEVKHEGAKFIDNTELEDRLARRDELEPLKDEFKALDEEIKATFKEIPEVYVGTKWQIMGKWRETNKVDTKALPDDIRKKYSTKTKSWITNIVKL